MNRDEIIKFRVTKKEKKLIEEYADKLGMSTSRYVRNVTMLELESLMVKSGFDEKLLKAFIYIKKKLHEPLIEERLKED